MRNMTLAVVSIMVSGLVIIIIVDMWLLAKYGAAGTISTELWLLSRQAPWLVFVIGFLAGLVVGHILWPLHINGGD